jgi:hypothetical protein
MRTVQRIEKKGNATRLVAVEAGGETSGSTARVALIQALIPLGLDAVARAAEGRANAEATPPGQGHAGDRGLAGRWRITRPPGLLAPR